MNIGSIFESMAVSPASLGEKSPLAEDKSASSSKQDTVSISTEAREAYAANLAAQQGMQAESGSDASEEDDPSQAFSKYLNEAKGNVSGGSGGGSVEEQIEKLKEKLAKLQEKLGKIAQSDNLSEEAKGSQMQAINGEIEQVMSQISELMGQLTSETA